MRSTRAPARESIQNNSNTGSRLRNPLPLQLSNNNSVARITFLYTAATRHSNNIARIRVAATNVVNAAARARVT
jgi:hypothetical protein